MLCKIVPFHMLKGEISAPQQIKNNVITPVNVCLDHVAILSAVILFIINVNNARYFKSSNKASGILHTNIYIHIPVSSTDFLV